MKVIFLDIDGVLLPFDVSEPGCTVVGDRFSRTAVAALNELVARTGARIVITSSWRCIEGVDVRAIFQEEGIAYEIAGETPSRIGRAEEIAAWLEVPPEPVESFVIIDDFDTGLSQAFPGRLVKTDPVKGFTWAKMLEAARILSV